MLPAFFLYFPYWMIHPTSTSTIAICLNSFLGSPLQLQITQTRGDGLPQLGYRPYGGQATIRGHGEGVEFNKDIPNPYFLSPHPIYFFNVKYLTALLF